MATELVTRTTARLVGPSADWRAAALIAPGDAHDRLFAECEALLAVEHAGDSSGAAPSGPLRGLSWNAERLKYLAASASPRPLGVDVILLTELDRGMACSGNRDTVGEPPPSAWRTALPSSRRARAGRQPRAAWHAGIANRRAARQRHPQPLATSGGRHGPARRRLLFDGSNGERRIGGGIGRWRASPASRSSVHLESHSDAVHRALQTTRLLDAVEVFAGADPIVIGGDFNTATVGYGEKGGLTADRLCNPVPFEPLFEVMAQRGFGWEAANEMGVATQRTRPDGTPAPPFGRIDWLFVRGLEARDAATLAAVDAAGAAISDHEILAVTAGRR